ncbi:MAG: hypothetical protein HWQ35_32470 [Nostoc sp. NMS1]|uniref:hypothetical protein n=1 Tax=unclassified Nostoc TaxID=2593658 RepID=UPI0025F99C12|nr:MULTISPECIES: hypothetical protein [unclassified Nostoc]MBN3911088.1 hypothetical protein [Nostoc sp. NMS1]MBN3990043.1 hypothetical protein [Nostoc sp. NMS2]
MEKITNGKQRTPQQKGSNQTSHVKSEPRGMGIIPAFGGKPGDYEIGTSRKDSNEPDAVSPGEWTDGGISGKLIGQLIDENEKQLAYHQEQCYYHQTQAQKVQDTLERLRQIPETLADIVHTQ